MKIITILAFFFIIVSYSNCSESTTSKGDDEKTVIIHTNYGDIKLKLYNKTPLHRDNFLKLVQKGYYDSTLFHRVIPEFMIQGGDPDSKNAAPGAELGNGGPGYTIEAEFVPEYIHKRGVLAAAREADQINPEKRSSGSQFYIVQGKVFTNEELDKLENNINIGLKRNYFRIFIEKPENLHYKIEIDSLQKSRNMEALNKLAVALEPIIDSAYSAENTVFQFSKEQKEIYTTIGGAPHLDGNYTVYGEVIEGMEVVDKIASLEKNEMNRPNEDVFIIIEIVK